MNSSNDKEKNSVEAPSSLTAEVRNLPSTPGVYIYRDSAGEILYVGKAKNLKSRVSSYFRLNLDPRSKTYALVQKISSLKTINVSSELEALLLEAELIKKYLPPYNIVLKDDKSYIYIGIKNEKVMIGDKKVSLPVVQTLRKPDLLKIKTYFGPFPDGTTVKQLVRLFRKIFPFRDCSTSKFNKYMKLGSPCLYGHIHLCPAPCLQAEDLVKIHKQNILAIKKILQGKTSGLLIGLEREMKKLANQKDYEKAAQIRDVLQKFSYIRQSFRLPGEYIENPYLLDDLASQSTESIKEMLPFLSKLPQRIECYDISNISGKDAVGSMVVAINGKINRSEYKRFKVKFKNTPDDFDMMFEVLSRRLSHETGKGKRSWGVPDLIILDGGKGQVSAGYRALDDAGLNIPLVGLAKKFETIVHFDGKEFTETNFDKDLPGMKLIISLRDESHRFAQKYHHLLRDREIRNSVKEKQHSL